MEPENRTPSSSTTVTTTGPTSSGRVTSPSSTTTTATRRRSSQTRGEARRNTNTSGGNRPLDFNWVSRSGPSVRRSIYRLADRFSAEGDWDLATMIALLGNSPVSRTSTTSTFDTTAPQQRQHPVSIDSEVEEDDEQGEIHPRIRRFFFGFSHLRRPPTNLAEAYNATRMVSREIDDPDEEQDDEISDICEESRGEVIDEIAEDEEDEDDDEEEDEDEENRVLLAANNTSGTRQIEREDEDMDHEASEDEEDRFSAMVHESDSAEKYMTNDDSSSSSTCEDLNSVSPRISLALPPPPAYVRDPYANISIREFYADEAGHNPRLTMALFYLNLAERDVGQDQIAKAIKHYRTSIKYFATAEAHTYLGWMYSRQGSYRRAIKECHKAIACDDTFGNPYNDIGFYLLTMNYIRESISWFERAKRAARASNRIAPYVNLAGVYRRLGMPERALVECHEALRYDPSNRFLQDRRKELVHELGEHCAAVAIIQGSCLDTAGR